MSKAGEVLLEELRLVLESDTFQKMLSERLEDPQRLTSVVHNGNHTTLVLNDWSTFMVELKEG